MLKTHIGLASLMLSVGLAAPPEALADDGALLTPPPRLSRAIAEPLHKAPTVSWTALDEPEPSFGEPTTQDLPPFDPQTRMRTGQRMRGVGTGFVVLGAVSGVLAVGAGTLTLVDYARCTQECIATVFFGTITLVAAPVAIASLGGGYALRRAGKKRIWQAAPYLDRDPHTGRLLSGLVVSGRF